MRRSVSAFLLLVGSVTEQHHDIDIDTAEIKTILGLLSDKPYITQEVIFGEGEPIQPSEYVSNGAPLPVVRHNILKSDVLGRYR